MSKEGTPLLAKLSVLSVAVIASMSLSCMDATPLNSDKVRRILAKVRPVQPRLSGLAFGSCSSSNDLIPVTRCGSAWDLISHQQVQRLNAALRRRLEADATNDELHAAALIQLALSPRRESSLQSAAAYLKEAAALESDIERRALILSDLAAAHLLLGELLQSPLELVAALDLALDALDLDPDGEEAAFNRQLASYLLGFEALPNKPGEPWMEELHARLGSPDHDPPLNGGNRCPSTRDLRRAFDAWSEKLGSGGRPELAVQRPCLAQSEDRFFSQLIAAAESKPAQTARAWQVFRASEAALHAFDLEAATARLDDLRRLGPPGPLRLEGIWIEATLSYQRTAYDVSLEVLESLAREAADRSFFELSARAHRLAALIDQVRGDYGQALQHLRWALNDAKRTGSAASEAAVLSLLVEQQELVGREDDAWQSIVLALRSLDTASQQIPRIHCLHSAARLAHARGFLQVARLAHERAVSLAESMGPVPRISALKERGDLLVDIGVPDLARQDLVLARRLLEEANPGAEIAAVLEADLLLLEGRLAGDGETRRAALLEARERFRATEYNRRILTVQLALAKLTREQGDPETAMASLREAFADLDKLVAGVDGWTEATALVAAARPMVDEFLDLQLEHSPEGELLETLATFFGLGSGSQPFESPIAGQRLTYFVRDGEVLILLEAFAGLTLTRSVVDRQRLVELRDLFLLQLRSGAPEARLRTTAEPLGRLLVAPLVATLTPGEPLVIVADDVLAGLPFILLPFAADGSLLIDHFSISYSTDLGTVAEPPAPESLVAVGSAAAELGFPPLPEAEHEVRRIGGIYPSARLLLGAEASSERVRQALRGSTDAAHFAAHFVVNARSPSRSYLVLAGHGDDLGRLTLEDLLTASGEELRLLYLSGCETGRGLPPSARGIHSLAQVFTGAGIDRTVLSLWPLDDRLGAEMAVTFHRLLTRGIPAAEALRSAQLEHRHEPPALWAPLAIFY